VQQVYLHPFTTIGRPLVMGNSMKLPTRVLTAMLLVSATLFAGAAHAAQQWTNYHLRVTGFTPLSICPSGTLAYVNQSTSESRGYVAALLLAHASAKQVNLFVEADANGYCRIVEFAVGP
jgi:hypothetical protein